MSSSLFGYLILGLIAVIAVLIITPIMVMIYIITTIASIPSRVGKRVPIETWIYRGMDGVLDIELMRQFRDDIHHRIRPHLVFAEDYERWWVIREMELTIERTNSSLQSGEYALVILLAIGGVFFDSSVYGLPMSLVMTLLAISLSGLIIIRVVTINILAFTPELHREESTHELTVRMAFNRGPLSRGSSLAIALLTILIGAFRGQGYEIALDIVEWVASKTYPGNAERWRVEE